MADPTLLGLVVRRPSMDDASRIFRLISACDLHDFGSVDITQDDTRDELSRIDVEHDAWLVQPAEPEVDPIAWVGTQLRSGVEHRTQVSVHPEWRRRGIGSWLVERGEARARERIGEAPPDARVTMVGWVKADSADRAWAEHRGFAWARRFQRMRIDMADSPPGPKWPEGVSCRAFVVGQDERVTYEALEAAFADHWGHVAMPFEEWVTRTGRSDFDPGLWFLAMDGEDVVGTATNSTIPDPVGQIGWISGLGVVPSHRRRGLARAMLLHSFAEFWRRGLRSVALGVDADSLTGATRLYESAGMYVEEQFDQVRKVLREGVPQETA
jgi:mycothiol synthase